MCHSLMIALFNERMSTQILISFGLFQLGHNNNWRYPRGGAFYALNDVIIFELFEFFLHLFSYMERDSAMWLSHGFDRFIYMYACWFTLSLYLPIPLVRLGNSLRKSGASGGRLTGGSTVLTALIRFNAC